MRLPAIVVGLLAVAVFGCVGCGGPKKEAVAPETNPWADYKGTYAGPADAKSTDPAPTAKASAPPSSDGARTMSSSAALKTDSAPASPPKPARKVTGKKKKPKKPGAPATNGGELD